jgi:hypothetical protein
MEIITNGHKKTMGETGAGITNADEIDMSQTNNFTNKWGAYLEANHKTMTLTPISISDDSRDLPMVL